MPIFNSFNLSTNFFQNFNFLAIFSHQPWPTIKSPTSSFLSFNPKPHFSSLSIFFKLCHIINHSLFPSLSHMHSLASRHTLIEGISRVGAWMTRSCLFHCLFKRFLWNFRSLSLVWDYDLWVNKFMLIVASLWRCWQNGLIVLWNFAWIFWI
jgi:hypothetical protein